jgi:membrane fusion protein (multidrug efflux system)
MRVLDALVPSVVANLAVVLSFLDAYVIRDRVFSEFPDTSIMGDDRAAILARAQDLLNLPQLSLIQKEHISRLCHELRETAGLTRERREQIVQISAGAALLTGFVTNIIIIVATAVFTLLSVSEVYRVFAALIVVAALTAGIFQVWYALMRLPLSSVEEYHIALPGTRGDRGPSWGLLLRLELIVLNTLLFVELALSTLCRVNVSDVSRAKSVGRRHRTMTFRLSAACLLAGILACAQAGAQAPGQGASPSVGVVRAEKQPITETSEFVGRIAAVNRVDLVARVTAFIDRQTFDEGSEVKKGDLLYVLEQPPFQADLEAKKAAVQQAQAQLGNATLAFQRAEALLKTPAGQQSAVDTARATMLSDAAQVLSAQAQQKQAEINLGYTEIRAPIDGKIGRSLVTPGNVVSPGSGLLTRIVSQDPIYVLFPVPLRTALELRQRYAGRGGLKAVVVKLRLPDGRIYNQTGALDFFDNTVATSTDTLMLRGTIPNPVLTTAKVAGATVRELVADEFVTVLLEGAEPIELLAIPRAAILSDLRGDYVFTVDAQNKVEERRITLGQSSPTTASVLTGLNPGDLVVVDGVQKVHAGSVVAPTPVSPAPSAPPTALKGGTAAAAPTPEKSVAARQ